MAKSRKAQTGSEPYAAGDTGTIRRRTSNDARKPGGQPGNGNAQKHGRRTAKAIKQRKLAHAKLKALTHVLIFQSMVLPAEGRLRPRPIRSDQMALLIDAEPGLAAIVRAAGLYLPDRVLGKD